MTWFPRSRRSLDTGERGLKAVAIAKTSNQNKHMNTRCSPYNRPWIWFLRETSVIALFSLAAWGVFAAGLTGIPQILVLFGLVAVALVLTIKMVTDIFVAGFCQWSIAMGREAGELVASIRCAGRGRQRSPNQ